MHVPQTDIILRHEGVELVHKTLPPGEYVIGRIEEAEIFADTPLISRQHARLTINYDHLLIEDLGSSNGTFINDKPVTESTRLFPNQSIRLGTVQLEIHRQRTPTEPDLSLAPAQATIRRLLPDELLAEKRYAIGSIVAQGGMGAILAAQQSAMKRSVAMKVMLDSAGETDVFRFIEEAQITGQLEHPNIVPVHELSVDENGQPFYTMKMVRGITLKKVLELLDQGVPETVKKYPLPALLTIFQKVCDAIAFAHSKGVIHRDLKPENLMLDDFGVVLVMDWGLAKVIGHGGAPGTEGTRNAILSIRLTLGNIGSTEAGNIMGTPQYMSPEQARGEVETLDARSDIYALGGILYKILTLRPPVEGQTVEEILNKVRSGKITPPSQRMVRTKRHPSATPAGPPAAQLTPPPPIFDDNAPTMEQTASNVAPVPNARRESVARETISLPHLPDGKIPASLDAVVLKAMAPEKSGRYQTVTELQRDLAAYQNGFAPSAENAGRVKQFVLFVKRHKAASLGVAAALLIGTTFGSRAIIEGRRAERGEALATVEASRANHTLAELKKTAPTLLALAESEASFQHFDSALQKLDAALALDPLLLPAYWRRAWILLGKEQWSAAGTAIRVAQEKDPAHASLAAILPVIDEFANAQEQQRWVPKRMERLIEHLETVRASGELAALSGKLRLGAEPKRQLVSARLNEWLGQNRSTAHISVTATGLINVLITDAALDTLEPLRGMPIDELKVTPSSVTSLEPLRGMHLSVLITHGSPISDLSPLQGMPLRELDLSHALGIDLSPLRGAPLEKFTYGFSQLIDLSPLNAAPLREVSIGGNRITDLSFLTHAPLEVLSAQDNRISDLTPLHGKKLRRLFVGQNPIIDLSPLRDTEIEELDITCWDIVDYTPLLQVLKLEKLRVSRGGKKKIEPLRQHPTLKFLAYDIGLYRPVAEFWADYDAQQAEAQKKAAAPK